MTTARLAWLIAACVVVYTAGELVFAWIILGWHP